MMVCLKKSIETRPTNLPLSTYLLFLQHSWWQYYIIVRVLPTAINAKKKKKKAKEAEVVFLNPEAVAGKQATMVSKQFYFLSS